MYGTFTARVKSGAPGGMVTSFISMSDEKDEIDWEWTGGKDVNSGQTNYFSKGVVEYGKSQYFDTGSSTAENYHEYSVNWTKDSLSWLIDGKVVRTITPAQIGSKYPDTPSRIQFAVWDGGAGAAGTRNWAGGYIDWAKSNQYTASIDWVSIQWYTFSFIDI
jgi:beta-glucanase (GH16 family)